MIDISYIILLILLIVLVIFGIKSEKNNASKDLGEDLTYYRNLSESLMQDVIRLREENIKLKNEKL